MYNIICDLLTWNRVQSGYHFPGYENRFINLAEDTNDYNSKFT